MRENEGTLVQRPAALGTTIYEPICYHARSCIAASMSYHVHCNCALYDKRVMSEGAFNRCAHTSGKTYIKIRMSARPYMFLDTPEPSGALPS